MCGNVCANAPHATGVCVNGGCTLLCTGTYLNCNGLKPDGCEIDASSDAGNCGMCGHVCPQPNVGAPVCSGGLCIAVLFNGPPAGTTAPNGVTVSLACTSGVSVVLTGDFVGAPKTIGCDFGAATARLTFTAGDGIKTITATQAGVGNSRTFVKQAGAAIDTWTSIPNTGNACGFDEARTHPRKRTNVIVKNTFSTHMQVSTDGGANWQIPVGDPFSAVDPTGPWEDPYSDGTFYTVIETYPTLGDVYRTTDGGLTWQMTGAAPTLPAGQTYDCANGYDFGRLSVDANHRLYLGIPYGIAYSDDAGANWTMKTYPQLSSSFVTHVTPLPDASVIWIGTDNQGVFKSTDQGNSIQPDAALQLLSPPYTTCSIQDLQAGVLLSPYNPKHLIAAAGWQDGKVLRSTNGGQSWTPIGGAMGLVGAYGMSFLTGASITFEPGDIDTFWIQSYVRDCSSNGIIMTNDGGQNFVNIAGTQTSYTTTVGRAVDTNGREVLFQADNCESEYRELIDRF